MTSRIRILVVDDHEVVRKGVSALLKGAGWVCGEASNGREALEKTKRLRPQVVVMDIGMPEMNGLEATRQIVKDLPKTKVLILTLHESEQIMQTVLNAGARGYVLKSDAGEVLLDAVKIIHEHNAFFASRSGSPPQDSLELGDQRDGWDASTVNPTPRELEVVQLLAEGRANKEIATILRISVHTVETHRANIMQKLGLHSLSDLTRYAIRNKIAEA